MNEISVIIPVYNHARALRRSLRTLENQNIIVKDVIIIDDGSTDNFDDTVKDLKTKLKIKILKQTNKGANAARNFGLSFATGEYVIFWDADTLAKPDMLKKMLDAIEKNPKISYAYSQYRFGWKKMKSHYFDPVLLKKINYIDGTSLVRRLDLPDGGCDAKLKRFQDWDLWLTMLENNETGIFVPEVLFKKITWGRKGISSWLPSFLFRLPWKTRAVKDYEEARQIIYTKHKLI